MIKIVFRKIFFISTGILIFLSCTHPAPNKKIKLSFYITESNSDMYKYLLCYDSVLYNNQIDIDTTTDKWTHLPINSSNNEVFHSDTFPLLSKFSGGFYLQDGFLESEDVSCFGYCQAKDTSQINKLVGNSKCSVCNSSSSTFAWLNDYKHENDKFFLIKYKVGRPHLDVFENGIDSLTFSSDRGDIVNSEVTVTRYTPNGTVVDENPKFCHLQLKLNESTLRSIKNFVNKNLSSSFVVFYSDGSRNYWKTFNVYNQFEPSLFTFYNAFTKQEALDYKKQLPKKVFVGNKYNFPFVQQN